MTAEFKYSREANNGTYLVTYYCYNATCPARTKEEPWPSSNGVKRYVEVVSKKGNRYRRKLWVCKHCGEVMTGTFSGSDFG